MNESPIAFSDFLPGDELPIDLTSEASALLIGEYIGRGGRIVFTFVLGGTLRTHWCERQTWVN